MSVKSKVTSRDVANLAGVSQSLVSRAFTGKISMPVATKAKIFAAAKQLGWSPNALAQGIVNGGSPLVPVITAELSFSWNSHVLVQLLELIETWQLKPLILYASSAKDVNKLIRDSLHWRAKGVIVAAGRIEHDVAEEILSSGQFLVSFNRPADHPGVFIVRTDNAAGGREAVCRLIESGCQSLIVAGSREGDKQTLRVQGAIAQAQESGLPTEFLASAEMTYQSGFAHGERLTKRIAHIQNPGIFAQNDTLAFGLIDALKTGHYYAPDHYKIIGFDDLPHSDWGAYQLSSFRHPLAEMVGKIRQYVADFIPGEPIDHSPILVKPQFIKRNSN